MKRFLGWLDRRWYLFLAGGCIGAELLVFLIFRENSYFTVQDNLDLFVAHFQVLSHSNSWFAHGATVPMLGGISRDSLSSEWNLYNILYTFMPVFWAYLTGYFLKILIGTGSFVLLAKDGYQKAYPRYRGIGWAVLWTSAAVPGIWNRVCIDSARSVYFTADLSERGKMVVCTAFCLPVFIVFFLLRIFSAGVSGVCGCDCVDSRQKILRSSGSRCAGAGGWLCLL